ncbi:hypothetical protein G6F37_012578 [Rhizopus arrhizus]|nr:hypothetical protein G6F38_011805 [Rhizopus arrhizus]KAG1142782.1 hypothetical protein G6F37_012578 [Rhizopus arrhizus]
MIQVYSLCKTVNPNEAKFLKSIAKLIEKLPNQALMDTIKETEHCQRYVEPILSGLFDDPEQEVLFRWTSVLNEEYNQDSSISSARPDSVMTRMDGLFFGFSLGFAEIKHTTSTSKYLVSKDLIRLGILSKNSIDQHDLQGCLTIQVVGFQMVVFLTTLLADGLYVMVEIGNITIPASIREIPQYLTNSDEIISILECFETWCSPSPQPQPSFKRKSLDDESFARLVSPSRSVKRRSYTGH